METVKNTAFAQPSHVTEIILAKEETPSNPATDNPTSTDNVGFDEVGRDGTEKSRVDKIRALLGMDVVLLPIARGEKAPKLPGWQSFTTDKLNDPDYLARLEAGNIGVLLGVMSGGLCAIDIDDDGAVEPFLELNPQLRGTMRSRGSRGQQIWVRILGDYPDLTKLVSKSGTAFGEWRATGGQSVISGVHPNGNEYALVSNIAPVRIEFDEIKWPAGLLLPWVKTDFDDLVAAEGEPFLIGSSGGVTLNQMFFVRKMLIEHRICYDSSVGEFYEYDVADGLWKIASEDRIKRQFTRDLTAIAKESKNDAIFFKRTDATVKGLTALLQAEAEDRDVFVNRPAAIHVKNGMIRFERDQVVLKSFHPDYFSRNQCPYAFDANAECPRFKDELLGGALDQDDIALLQKWAGAVILGQNEAQRFLLRAGTAGGGKSTLMTILEEIIGIPNIAQLRTEHLGSRFELFSFVGKTLLTGKDVAPDFLMQKSVHVLKGLVGNDRLEAEKKRPERPSPDRR